MKKLSFQNILLILVFLIFVIGLITGDISFNFKKENNSQKISQEEIIRNLDNLSNITGELYISPDNSWYNFYENISNIDHILKIQTYEFTKKELKSKFRELLEKGVNIKLIMEDYKYQQFQNTWKQIAEYFTGYDNFEIKSDKQMGTEYIHSKINLVDSGFWIQTANLTHSSFYNNREHFFYSTNTVVWNSLNTIFEKDWNGEEIEIEDIHPNLLICNINCRNVIETLLSGAQKSILIQTQYIVDERILDMLKNKISLYDSTGSGGQDKKKLDIRFIVSDTNTNDDLLDYFGPAVARKFTQYYNHTKMILIDDEILILGSMNLSDNSLDKNREIGILLIDKKMIDKFKKLFDKDWKNSKYIFNN